MSKKTIKYKDTVAAQGSALYEALESNNHQLAEKIYQECEKEYRKYWPKKAARKFSEEEYKALLKERAALLDLYFRHRLDTEGHTRLEILRQKLDDLEELKYAPINYKLIPPTGSKSDGES
jgi:hypothetical protein